MKIFLFLLGIAVTILAGYFFYVEPQARRITLRELAAEAAMHQRESESQDREKACKAENDELRSQLAVIRSEVESFKVYGKARSNGISASFAKTISEREVDVSLELRARSRWECSELAQDRHTTEWTESGLPLRTRKGLLLGKRSTWAFVLTAIRSDIRSIPAPSRPAPGKVPGRVWGTKSVDYVLKEATLSLECRVSNTMWNLARSHWTVVHAWPHGALILVVIGAEVEGEHEPVQPDMPMLSYQTKNNWVGLTEIADLQYPVLELNRSVGILPLNLTNYDERGFSKAWCGFSGDIRAVFSPVDGTDRPVFHSLIAQETESNALFYPFWEEKRQLDAPSEKLELSQLLPIEVEAVGGPTTKALWSPDPKRHALLHSYRSMVEEAPRVDYRLPPRK